MKNNFFKLLGLFIQIIAMSNDFLLIIFLLIVIFYSKSLLLIMLSILFVFFSQEVFGGWFLLWKKQNRKEFWEVWNKMTGNEK